MIVFRTCCGCCSLSAGCIIIGALMILLSIFPCALGSTAVIAAVISIIFSAVLIIGVVTKNRLCLWTSIVFHIVVTILLIISTLAYIVIIFIFMDLNAVTSEFKQIVILLVFLVVLLLMLGIACEVFCTLVIYSYVCELREEEKRLIGIPASSNISTPVSIVCST